MKIFRELKGIPEPEEKVEEKENETAEDEVKIDETTVEA